MFWSENFYPKVHNPGAENPPFWRKFGGRIKILRTCNSPVANLQNPVCRKTATFRPTLFNPKNCSLQTNSSNYHQCRVIPPKKTHRLLTESTAAAAAADDDDDNVQ